MGSQLSMGRGTLGTTGFFIGTPGNPPPIGGGGGTVWYGNVECQVGSCDITCYFRYKGLVIL